MSHPGPTGNGCSLEDCYTNLFALTDICGIKWRKLIADPDCCASVDHLDDPVLVSYSRCIQSDILCVWRRVQHSTDHRVTDHLSCNKELWLFWYGEEPSNLDKLLSSDLKEEEHGAWDKDKDKADGGLSYECRTLLFKAIHNLIERCLLSKGFMRLGRWFVQPYDPAMSQADRSSHLSFSFNFFLHGESSVCASIEVKQHPPVWLLSPQHLTLAQENHASMQVILAPYGLNGTLTGHSYRDTDQSAKKVLDDWLKFYPIESSESRDGGIDINKIPPLVEVLVAGVRMKYPSCYVLICDSEESPARMQTLPMQSLSRPQSVVPNGPLTPPTSPADASMLVGDIGVKVIPSNHYSGSQSEVSTGVASKTAQVLSSRIKEKVTQDHCVTSGISKRSMEMIPEDKVAGVWDFDDPTVKATCNCARHRAKNKAGLAGQGKGAVVGTGKHTKGDKPEKLERQQSRLNRSVPFHRRSPLTDDLLQFDMDIIPQVQVTSGSNSFNSTNNSVSLPQLKNSSDINSVESPSPAAPSPLDEPNNQLVNNQSVDPTMPKLSPHPPAEAGTEKDSTNSNNVKPVSGEPNQSNVITTGPSDFIKPNDASTPKTNVTGAAGSGGGDASVFSPSVWANQSEAKTASINNWIKSQQKQVDCFGIKRPNLPTLNSDQDELVTESLYNFDTIYNWCDFPAKKARVESRNPSMSPSQLDSKQNLSLNTNMPGSQKHQKPLTPQPSLPDPYEFSDEASINPATVSTRSFRSSRDEMFYNRQSPYNKMEEDAKDSSRHNSDSYSFQEELGSISSPPATPTAALTTSLTQVADLIPKTSDLDKLFESDSDNDDPFSSPTQTADKSLEDHKLTTITSEGTIAASELARMYPTPPSLENNTNSSPGAGNCHDHIMEINYIERPVIKMEMSSLSIEDLSKSCVFKPPDHVEFLGSSKYSPIDLANGKKSPIPEIPEYKASWQYPMNLMDKTQHSSYINIPSIENIPSLPSRVPSSNAIEASPATFHQNSVGQQRTPLSYELQSPASNASSYLNKTLNSIDNQGTNHQIPEVDSLIVNVMLSDSRLNLYRDHNFDSCNICVCNMNIKGADVIYLPETSGVHEAQYKCSCGFSAIANRKCGHNAGLFYEDELDITGIRDDRYDHRKPSLISVDFNKDEHGDDKDGKGIEDVSQVVLELLLGQFTVPYPSLTARQLLIRLDMATVTTYERSVLDSLQLQDGNEITYLALDQGRQAMEHCAPNRLDDPQMKAVCLHRWQFLQGANLLPVNSQDEVGLLKGLQPILQDAIQNKRVIRLWERTYKLSGPLTWKEFHQLAGRGMDENCAPQPIPMFLVGHDRDWLSVSPFALRSWDKQLVEPYGKPRDIAYVVVAPENDHVLSSVKKFFKELSTVYELCRLGRHCPVSKVLRDGIMRVGKKATQKLADEQVDEWFKHIGDTPVAAKLRLYAQVCRYHLAPHLAQQSLDKSLFEPHLNHRPGYKQTDPSPTSTAATASSMSSSSSSSSASTTASNDHGTFSVPSSQTSSDDNKDSSQNTDGSPNQKDNSSHDFDRDDHGDCPALVVYLIDAFSYSQDWDDQLNRLSMLGLLRCYQQLHATLPEHLQNNMYLQIIPLKTIMENTERGSNFQLLKSISFSVFTTCRWNLSHSILGKSLTGFGPAAASQVYLNKKRDKEKSGSLRLYSPPFILAPTKDIQSLLAESCGEKQEKNMVLFCVYCLSEDQRWLLASCTDERGEIMETCSINIEIPNRNRRKKASARKIGLQKLWDFILGVLSMTTTQCRLVIGRLGRLGHGELKGWSGLLSKKNLHQASKKFKDVCNTCSFQNNFAETPGILSACLVSLESHSSFHVMCDAVKQEEKMSSNCPLQTPRDASTTHILVFPTSATAQANSQPLPPEGGPIDLGSNNIVDEIGDDDTFFSGVIEDFGAMNEELNFLDVFQEMTSSPKTSLPGIGNVSDPGSPIMDTGRHSSSNMNGLSMGQNNQSIDPQDEAPNLLQQPLAMGYYISSAKPGTLPKWFWSSCPESEYNRPSSFKAALHIHCSSNQDDFLQSTQNRNSHPLDSSLTCDVLRYVLENYNALSWLTFDTVKNDRQSCLPIHFVVLMQMYHALNAYV